jgi:hypothetical protein
MLIRKTIAVYGENHMERTNTLWGKMQSFSYVNEGGTYSNHWALKGFVCFT